MIIYNCKIIYERPPPTFGSLIGDAVIEHATVNGVEYPKDRDGYCVMPVHQCIRCEALKGLKKLGVSLERKKTFMEKALTLFRRASLPSSAPQS